MRQGGRPSQELTTRDCGLRCVGLLHGNQVRHVQLQSAGPSRIPHARSRRTARSRSSTRGPQVAGLAEQRPWSSPRSRSSSAKSARTSGNALRRASGRIGEDLRRLASFGTAIMSSTRSRAVAFTRSSANLGSTFRRAKNKSKISALQTRTISHARRTLFGGRGIPENSRSSSRDSRSTASAETCSA